MTKYQDPTINAIAGTDYSDRFLTSDAIIAKPPLEWQVDGWIPKHAVGTLWGKWGAGKTFIAIDLAISVAAGIPWLDTLKVEPGPVIYAMAEGHYGLRDRLEAALDYRQTNPPTLHWFDEDDYRPINLTNTNEIQTFINAALPLKPVLIIIDTLARHALGVEENSNRDMGIVVDNLDRIRKQTGATVLLLHHPDKAENWSRGAGALPGGIDFEMKVKGDDRRVLELTKNKEGGLQDPIAFTLEKFGHSVVPQKVPIGSGSNYWGWTESMTLGAKTLSDTFGTEGATVTKWKDAALEDGLADRSFFRAKKDLEKQGFVAVDGGTGRNRRGGVWYLTEKGHLALGAKGATKVPLENNPGPKGATHPPPLEGCGNGSNGTNETQKPDPY